MQVGLPITGLLKATNPLIVEDFHHLQALTVPHGPRGELGTTATAGGSCVWWFLRPYWRITVSHQRLSDGTLHPQTQVSVNRSLVPAGVLTANSRCNGDAYRLALHGIINVEEADKQRELTAALQHLDQASDFSGPAMKYCQHFWATPLVQSAPSSAVSATALPTAHVALSAPCITLTGR